FRTCAPSRRGPRRATTSRPWSSDTAPAPDASAMARVPGVSSLTRIEKRLLILWFALAFVVWNGVYDMRMHDTVRGYLLEATRAEAGLGAGVDMRTYLRRGRVD